MQPRSRLVNNLVWLLASIGLAFFVWLIATTQADPIRERVFPAIPIQVTDPNAQLLLVNEDAVRRTANVTVRARQSIVISLTRDDITVHAELAELGAGLHQVPLRARVADDPRAIISTQPSQISVEIAPLVRRQMPVRTEVIEELPTGYEVISVTPSETQVLVSGLEAQIDRVAALVAPLDLSEVRSDIEQEVALIPVDADGNTVDEVEVAQEVLVTVDVRQREDEREIPVLPNIDFDSLPPGYVTRLESYAPETVSVSASENILNLLPETLRTESIDLTDRTESFTATVSVPPPLPGVTIIEGETVEVQIAIEPVIGQARFEDVPVEVVGSREGSQVRVIPSLVTVLVTGPQPVINQLDADSLRVQVDLEGLEPGSYDLSPVVPLATDAIPAENITVLPSTIGVIIEREPGE